MCLNHELKAYYVFLIRSNFFIKFEIQKYYQNKPKFNGVYSRNNLPKIKDRVSIINLDSANQYKLNG